MDGRFFLFGVNPMNNVQKSGEKGKRGEPFTNQRTHGNVTMLLARLLRFVNW